MYGFAIMGVYVYSFQPCVAMIDDFRGVCVLCNIINNIINIHFELTPFFIYNLLYNAHVL